MAREMIMMEHERILMAHEMILMARELILTEHEVILMELSRITETASWLKERLPVPPDVVVVLGSGLGELAEQVESPTVIPYADVPPIFLFPPCPGMPANWYPGGAEGQESSDDAGPLPLV